MRALSFAALLAIAIAACGRGDAAAPRGIGGRRIPVRAAADSDLTRAEIELARGRPWQATRILEPRLRDPARRTPDAVLLAAQAAAAWQGWSTVATLLGKETWLDTHAGGAGRALLARALLERGSDSLAAMHAARAAERSAAATSERGERLVTLARARDRMHDGDAARSAYEQAAAELPGIADWLFLRAAAYTTDAGTRSRRYAAVTIPAARTRVGWAEAEALANAGEHLAAAAKLDSLGSAADAFRERLLADSTAAPAMRDAMVAYLRRRAGTGEARRVVTLLDSIAPTLTAQEELVVARSARASGPASRAATAYSRAFAGGVGTVEDRFAWATVLSSAGRDTDAARQFALVRAPSASANLAADAAYGRARSLLRAGNATAAKSALRALIAAQPSADASASARYLIADLATDDGDDATARREFRELARRFPRSALAPRSRFRAALIAYVAGDKRSAAAELDSIWTMSPSSDEATAARYWSGRAWSDVSDAARARERWQATLSGDPLSYYAMTSAQRLGVAMPIPPTAPDTFAAIPAIDAALRRAELLERIGFAREAQLEYAWIAEQAGGQAPTETALAIADAFRGHGIPSRGIAIATRALARGAPADARTYRLMYPMAAESVLIADAGRRGLDQGLVAGLIRQESSFNPRAISPAGAVGLMQVVPSVGRQIARALDYPTWDPALLQQPDVNIELGVEHLAAAVRGADDLAHALAAYNAGDSRVRRWKRKAGADRDAEIFIERIPYVETRDYVRIVLRNRGLYRGLYGWGAGAR